MTAATAPAGRRPGTRRGLAPGRPGLAAVRLLGLELRHNAMLWVAPVAIALFWFTAAHKTLATPPLWHLRAASMQADAVLAFASPVAGAAAWMGSRESRRRTTELMSVTARPRPGRLLATWTATTCWALVSLLACVAVVYGVTARQATWGGPLWWPAAVAAATLPALTALGFAAGTLLPSRFTAPLAALATFFLIALSTELIQGSQSYWQISPIVSGPWDLGPDPDVGAFYPFLPDLAIAQVMFLAGLTAAVLGALALPTGSRLRPLRRSAAAVTTAGLLAAGTAVALAGTGRLDAHGMIAIPALHDAGSDLPLRYSPVCGHTTIPVCVNPAYATYLPATEAALAPVLSQIAGLPGAPARISQAAPTYSQGRGNSVSIRLGGPVIGGVPPVVRVVLPSQLPGPASTTSELASQLRSSAGPSIVAAVTGDGPGASQAQHAVTTALLIDAGVLPRHSPSPATHPTGRGVAGPSSAARAGAGASAGDSGHGGGRGGGGSRAGSGDRAGAGARAGSRGSARSARTGREQSPGRPPGSLAPGSPAYAAAQRFAALPAAARRGWLLRHLAALRAGDIRLGQLP